MSVEIDTRPIWLLLAFRALRPLFFIALAVGFIIVATMETPEGLISLWPEGDSGISTLPRPMGIERGAGRHNEPSGYRGWCLCWGCFRKGETYSLFGNEAVFFILGAFILAGAVMQSGLSNRIALYMMGRYGGSPKKLLLEHISPGGRALVLYVRARGCGDALSNGAWRFQRR